jgi:glycosyltransferase involved in cell wall biosynthesis
VARVSVITPAHNSADYIGEALVSVHAQTYDDWEVVVTDDASSDATADIAAAFGDRVTVVRSETNIGPAAARNLALAHVHGELVALLDADDLWEPAFLAEHVAAFDQALAGGGRPGIVTGDARVLTPSGFQSRTYRDELPLDGPPSLRGLLERNPIFVSSLVPRAAIDEAGGFDPEIWGSEDFDLWLRIAERGYQIVVLQEALAVYRRHASALTASQARAARSQVLAYSRAIERGRLDPAAARVARRQLRYSRAVEAVALAVEPGPEQRHARRQLMRRLPLVAGVALSHPRLWPVWARGMRSRLTRS